MEERRKIEERKEQRKGGTDNGIWADNISYIGYWEEGMGFKGKGIARLVITNYDNMTISLWDYTVQHTNIFCTAH